MKPKNQSSQKNLKSITILTLFFLFILYLILRPNFSPFQPIKIPHSLSICNKIPHSLSESLIHYATTKAIPIQNITEISVTWRVLEDLSPCNFLVFGLGLDSLMWASLNHGGRTVFLEESDGWMRLVKEQMPSLEMYHVVYDTKVTQAIQLLQIGKSKDCQTVSDPRYSKCPLALKNLPEEVYDTEWDLIMVDAPTAWDPTKPGRMKAIYTSGLLARNKRDGETHVFVHDIERAVENKFSRAFLCEGYEREEVGRLGHFVIPSHRSGFGRPFCP
ncbi:Glucuronoxylan 4-O-methyltransferase [Handroanthus impetiginosus]|uniref:Glucuronoxylan 4-O-methyltransferase n=1 Tax=Handroanthus impetiginosus TaxID=429701 RepID=A0A2G9GKF2_9LAMI|nr:Glucuronoxylan 4-O-methyltransferase [Handroanthus impetiginosus]